MNNADNQTYDQNKFMTGVDAMYFFDILPDNVWDMIDTVIVDPPYYDLDNPKDVEKVNKRSKLKSKVKWDNPETRLMHSLERRMIIDYLRERVNKDAYLVHFHTDRERIRIHPSRIACEHVWVKPIHYTMAGNADRNNGEHIVIEGQKIKGKQPGRVLNKYIDALFSNDPNKDDWTPNGNNHIPRSCAKPFDLYSEIYRHLDSKYILDPFAGFGMSIKAGLARSAVVYACDVSEGVDYSHYYEYEVPEITEQTTLEMVFNE